MRSQSSPHHPAFFSPFFFLNCRVPSAYEIRGVVLVIGGGGAEIVAKSRQPIKFLSFQQFNNIDIPCFCHLQSILGSLVCVMFTVHY